MSYFEEKPVILRNSPHLVTELDGFTLEIRHSPIPDATFPSICVKYPDKKDKEGKVIEPRSIVTDQLILKWFQSFEANRPLLKIQVERNSLKEELKKIKKSEKELRWENAELKKKMVKLQAQVAKNKSMTKSELAKAQISALGRWLVPNPHTET